MEVRFGIFSALNNRADGAIGEGIVVDFTDNFSRVGDKKAKEISQPYYIRYWPLSEDPTHSGRVFTYRGTNLSHYCVSELANYSGLASRDIINMCLEGIGPVISLIREQTVIIVDATYFTELRELSQPAQKCRNLIPFNFVIP